MWGLVWVRVRVSVSVRVGFGLYLCLGGATFTHDSEAGEPIRVKVRGALGFEFGEFNLFGNF